MFKVKTIFQYVFMILIHVIEYVLFYIFFELSAGTGSCSFVTLINNLKPIPRKAFPRIFSFH